MTCQQQLLPSSALAVHGDHGRVCSYSPVSAPDKHDHGELLATHQGQQALHHSISSASPRGMHHAAWHPPAAPVGRQHH
jgi:hypothetical protein